MNDKTNAADEAQIEEYYVALANGKAHLVDPEEYGRLLNNEREITTACGHTMVQSAFADEPGDGLRVLPRTLGEFDGLDDFGAPATDACGSCQRVIESRRKAEEEIAHYEVRCTGYGRDRSFVSGSRKYDTLAAAAERAETLNGLAEEKDDSDLVYFVDSMTRADVREREEKAAERREWLESRREEKAAESDESDDVDRGKGPVTDGGRDVEARAESELDDVSDVIVSHERGESPEDYIRFEVQRPGENYSWAYGVEMFDDAKGGRFVVAPRPISEDLVSEFEKILPEYGYAGMIGTGKADIYWTVRDGDAYLDYDPFDTESDESGDVDRGKGPVADGGRDVDESAGESYEFGDKIGGFNIPCAECGDLFMPPRSDAQVCDDCRAIDERAADTEHPNAEAIMHAYDQLMAARDPERDDAWRFVGAALVTLQDARSEGYDPIEGITLGKAIPRLERALDVDSNESDPWRDVRHASALLYQHLEAAGEFDQ